MLWNSLKFSTENYSNNTWNIFWAKKIAHYIAWRISHTIVSDDIDSQTIKIWSNIPWKNLKVIATWNKEKIRNQLAIEVLLEDGKWVCCYIETKKIVNIPNTQDFISKIWDKNHVNWKEVINVITDKWELTCLYTSNLNSVGISWWYDKWWIAKKVTHIFRSRK